MAPPNDNGQPSGLAGRLSSFFNPGRADSLPPLRPLPAAAPIPVKARAVAEPDEVDEIDEPVAAAPSPKAKGTKAKTAPVMPATEVIPAGPKRRKAMSTIDDIERKWSMAGLVLAFLLAIFLPIYAHTSLHSAKDKTTGVTSEALLISGAILLFCVVALVGLLRRKRTLIAFAFFLSGLAFTLTFGPLGFGFILLGGWLMLRAYRIQKYGVPGAKQVAREAALRPRGSGRQARGASGKGAKAAAASSGPKAPTANKRYTPKAAPRKKVPKPVE
jgi:hypothetical protein